MEWTCEKARVEALIFTLFLATRNAASRSDFHVFKPVWEQKLTVTQLARRLVKRTEDMDSRQCTRQQDIITFFHG